MPSLKNKSKDKNDLKKYKLFRNDLTYIKNAAKAAYFQNLVEKSKGTSMMWKVVNKILQKNKCNLNSLPSELNLKKTFTIHILFAKN